MEKVVETLSKNMTDTTIGNQSTMDNIIESVTRNATYESITGLGVVAGITGNITDIISKKPAVPDKTYEYFTNNIDNSVCGLIAMVIIGGLLCVFGMLGNTLAYVVWGALPKNPAVFFMRALAVADNATLLYFLFNRVLLQWYVYDETFAFIYEYPNFNYIHKYLWPLSKFISIIDKWLVVFLAFSRYIAVCFPFKVHSYLSWKKIYFSVAFLVAFSLVFHIPLYFIYQDGLTDYNGKMMIINIPSPLYEDAYFQTIYLTVFWQLIEYILPLAFLIFINAKLILVIRHANAKRNVLTSKNAENDRGITLSMIGVVVIFIICAAPAEALWLAYTYFYTQLAGDDVQCIMKFCLIFIMVNSFVNPIVYFVMCQRFRQATIKLIMKCSTK